MKRFAFLLALLLVGCGGGGSSDNRPPASVRIVCADITNETTTACVEQSTSTASVLSFLVPSAMAQQTEIIDFGQLRFEAANPDDVELATIDVVIENETNGTYVGYVDVVIEVTLKDDQVCAQGFELYIDKGVYPAGAWPIVLSQPITLQPEESIRITRGGACSGAAPGPGKITFALYDELFCFPPETDGQQVCHGVNLRDQIVGIFEVIE